MTDDGAGARKPMIKHTVNGDEHNGWYCYVCQFFSRDVAKAAEHDGWVERGEVGSVGQGEPSVQGSRTTRQELDLLNFIMDRLPGLAGRIRMDEVTKLAEHFKAIASVAPSVEPGTAGFADIPDDPGRAYCKGLDDARAQIKCVFEKGGAPRVAEFLGVAPSVEELEEAAQRVQKLCLNKFGYLLDSEALRAALGRKESR